MRGFQDFSRESVAVRLCLHAGALHMIEISASFMAPIDSLEIDPT